MMRADAGSGVRGVVPGIGLAVAGLARGVMRVVMVGGLALASVAGCDQRGTAPPPELRTYGVALPSCLLFCRAAVDTSDAGDASSISSGISQDAQLGGSQ